MKPQPKKVDINTENDKEINQQYGLLNKLFEHRTRLTICALLSRYDRIAFSRFNQLIKETDGNLGAQLRKLEDAGFVKTKKEFAERRPITWYSITAKGSKALDAHIAALSALLGAET